MDGLDTHVAVATAYASVIGRCKAREAESARQGVSADTGASRCFWHVRGATARAKELSILAHSMGGLVARGLLLSRQQITRGVRRLMDRI